MMSKPVTAFSAASSDPSGDFNALFTKARQARRSPPKRSRKSEVAGSALVAALLGAQFGEEAAAAEDFAAARDELAFLRGVRICGGHVGFVSAPTHPAGLEETHQGHEAGAPATALSPAAHHFGAGNAPASASSAASRLQTRNPARITDDDHAGAGHAHAASGPAPTALPSGAAAGAGGGHMHGATTGAGVPSPALPHQNNPAMQKEHIAVMDLVPVSAATHVAVNNGSWFDPNTWANGQVPGAGAKVLIPDGVTVAYDGQSKASLFTVRVDGELDFATNVDTFMEVDTFVVSPTGKLTIGSESDPVDPSVTATISFADNGPINVAWDPMLLSRGLISHGSVSINGAEKESFLKVAVDPMKGDTTLTLEGPPAGWQVGDRIVLTGTHLSPNKSGGPHTPVTSATQDEELVITAIKGNVITFDKPLQFDHEAPRADLKAYVSNFTRNVVFENEDGAATPTHQRGHVMLMHSDDITVKYAEFDELGRTDKSERSFDIATLSSVSPDSNVRGRYSLHIHRAGVNDQEHPAIVDGNAVWGSPGWGYVHHDSNAIFSNNAAYNVFGAAFVAETGNETGRWDHNIAIKSLGVDHITKDAGDVNAFDLGRTGTGFWFQGRLVEAVGNVAASVPSGAGFTYFHRGADSHHVPIDPANTNMPDSLRYLDTVRSNKPNIAIFLNNESFATQTGLEIIKANPRQDHDLRSMIDSFLAWEVRTGVHLEYTGHYTIRDLDVVASDTKGIGLSYTVGLDLHNNVFDVVVNGANIEGFHTGVRQAKTGVAGLDFMNGKDQWDYVYIDVDVKNATYSFTNRTPGDKFLTATDLVDDRLFFSPGFIDTELKMLNGIYALNGVKTDSIGRTSASKIWDPNQINAAELRGSIEQNGYWTTTDGRKVALIEEYFSDRATGDVIKVGVFVEIPSSYKLAAGGFTRVTPTYNGVLNEASQAPVAADDAAHVAAGKSVVIDVLANDKDPDGDKIMLDGLFSQHGRVVMNDDGTVTYFADGKFSGEDTFYYFVQDSNGDITKGQVTVTVEI